MTVERRSRRPGSVGGRCATSISSCPQRPEYPERPADLRRPTNRGDPDRIPAQASWSRPVGRGPARVARAVATPAPPVRWRTAPAPPAPAVVACPNCGIVLDPPPKSTRLCPRCRRRIVVRRVEGRTIYLTEAAVEVFEAERSRTPSSRRGPASDATGWPSRDWSGRRADRRQRIDDATVVPPAVQAARTLYLAAVERAGPGSPARQALGRGRAPSPAAGGRALRGGRQPPRRRSTRSSRSTGRASTATLRESPPSPATPSSSGRPAVRRAVPTTSGRSRSSTSCARRACPTRAARAACAPATGGRPCTCRRPSAGAGPCLHRRDRVSCDYNPRTPRGAECRRAGRRRDRTGHRRSRARRRMTMIEEPRAENRRLDRRRRRRDAPGSPGPDGHRATGGSRTGRGPSARARRPAPPAVGDRQPRLPQPAVRLREQPRGAHQAPRRDRPAPERRPDQGHVAEHLGEPRRGDAHRRDDRRRREQPDRPWSTARRRPRT